MNFRPLHPQCSALTRLRYAPIFLNFYITCILPFIKGGQARPGANFIRALPGVGFAVKAPLYFVGNFKIEDSQKEVNRLSVGPVSPATFFLKPAATVIESADLYDFKGICSPLSSPPAIGRI